MRNAIVALLLLALVFEAKAEDVFVSGEAAVSELLGSEQTRPDLEPEFSLYRGAVLSVVNEAELPSGGHPSYRWVIEAGKALLAKVLAVGVEIPADQAAQYGELLNQLVASEEYGRVRPLRRATDPEVGQPILDSAMRAEVMVRFRVPEVFYFEEE